MITHPLLLRQLKRIGLTEEKAPTVEEWQKILERINRTYQEGDQERYLNEIAIEVSSRETSELNKKFEYAQKIAELGYWYYDRDNGQIIWSKEMYSLFGCDPTKSIPSHEEIMMMFENDSRFLLENLMHNAITAGESFELEAKLKTLPNHPYQWLYLAVEPYKSSTDKTCHTLSGVAINITRRKESEAEMHMLNQQLISSAHRAGMAEIATSVLHNIGNVLNSVNISAGLLYKYMQDLDLSSMAKVINLIEDNLQNLQRYFTEDPKGKMIPHYLSEVKQILADTETKIDNEFQRLNDNIIHIKDIVAMQNTLSGVSKLIEKVTIISLINAALSLNEESFTKNRIKIINQCEYQPELMTDKNKIMQILINLLQNAKDALINGDPNKEKQITIATQAISNDKIAIKVTDTGHGISPENISRLFSFGFTTKEKGHGFGLHSSALLAKELGGELTAESKGINCGATFTIILPLSNELSRREAHERQI